MRTIDKHIYPRIAADDDDSPSFQNRYGKSVRIRKSSEKKAKKQKSFSSFYLTNFHRIYTLLCKRDFVKIWCWMCGFF